ncbi:hypothetical protein GUJ93_ZPchr0004g40229 [Zizania palustris]|uniref:Uncharacterized protein n=1 Tax=Zizania palustris TaxID=103762 RepID=A0A8J5VN67_ZIZPA|nr:hypothetical protein GUJ93_ZPchr0004g39698 [Zizania palustris]KAG8064681.1 hypothetical protein GUJ93_ZPchr0004g40229 [Zizania palustris]
MGEAPAACSDSSVVVPRRAAAGHYFRLPRRGRRRVLVARLGGGGGGMSVRPLIRLGWLRRAVWRLAELCVASLSRPLGVPDTPPPWTGIEPYFAAPFLPAVLVRRAGKDY